MLMSGGDRPVCVAADSDKVPEHGAEWPSCLRVLDIFVAPRAMPA
jgi:hypothetical protein